MGDLDALFPVRVLQVVDQAGLSNVTGGFYLPPAPSLSAGARPVANNTKGYGITLPTTKLTQGAWFFNIATADAAGLYSWGLYGPTGVLIAASTPAGFAATGRNSVILNFTLLPQTLNAGIYYICVAANSNVLVYNEALDTATNALIFGSSSNFGASANGVCPANINLGSLTSPSGVYPAQAALL